MAKLEIVSFEVAKAIEEAGYPQGQEKYCYRSNGEMYIFENMFDHIPDYCCDAPTYIEVWVWLWRKKKVDKQHLFILDPNKDPEESISAEIKYLVDNNLIK